MPKKLIYGHADSKQDVKTAQPEPPKQNDPDFDTSIYKELEKVEVDAVSDERWKNSLVKSFNAPFNEAFDKTLDSMTYLPINVVDKSAGIIATDWKVDSDVAKADLAEINIFGDGLRIARTRYTVRIYDMGKSVDIAVIPFAQVTKNRRWFDGNPAVGVAQRLMKRITVELEKK